jgi:hypothetical protein
LTGANPLRPASWVIWLAVAALALNALVPIHLALDLGEAFGAARPATAAAPHLSLEWRLLALVTGHDAGDGKPDGDHHRHDSCAALGVLGAIGGFATAAPPALPLPAVVKAPPVLLATIGEPDRRPAAAYRSRAPPPG